MFILVVRGTHQYGDPNNMNAAWSKKWSHLEYDQFLIGNEDFSKWVIIDKESCVYKMSQQPENDLNCSRLN